MSQLYLWGMKFFNLFKRFKKSELIISSKDESDQISTSTKLNLSFILKKPKSLNEVITFNNNEEMLIAKRFDKNLQ
jgi:hypothetical protein